MAKCWLPSYKFWYNSQSWSKSIIMHMFNSLKPVYAHKFNKSTKVLKPRHESIGGCGLGCSLEYGAACARRTSQQQVAVRSAIPKK